MADIYSDGTYLTNNPSWHEEDAQWKASQIVNLLRRNELKPATIAEVGCGSGAVLEQLSRTLPDATAVGYDISADAIAIARRRSAPNLSFHHAHLVSDAAVYDVVLAIDVIEHVEDCYGFVRELKPSGRHKVFHIPLDLSAQAVLRGSPLDKVRKSVGHIHYFTKDTALALLRQAGHDIVDWFYTCGATDLPSKSWRGAVAKVPRRIAFRWNRDFASRAFGGYSMMVLTK